MMAWKRIVQIVREGNGIRLMLALVYVVMMYRFYTSGQDYRVFMGMFRVPDFDLASSHLEGNMYAIGFMVFGVALLLEQPSTYLSVPETMVYVRRRRGLPRFLGYCAIVLAYCLAYTGVQLIVAFRVVYASRAPLALGAVCAGWTLLVLVLTINLGYLGGNRAYGYLAASMMVLAPLSCTPVMRWLVKSSLLVPNWGVVLGILTIVLVAANYVLFNRLEII
ncbi:hypothetical protein [Bifidobacterium moukalabense]|uniref:hypothetical protein n=1 Tax=Bifidobacterium moukalabense TaxID=1333651 RepID=UPI0010F47813|nr:hypothetical protein [Bifidobacterium moukalabense]